MKKIIYLAIIAIIFAACSSNDDNNTAKKVYDTSNLIGEWYSENTSSATEIILGTNFDAEMTTYNRVGATLEKYDYAHGSWMFYSENNTLRYKLKYEKNNIEETTDYTLRNADANSIELMSKSGSIDIYYKIVQKEELSVGETTKASISTNDPIINYSSSTPDIVTVDESGDITAKGMGTGYIVAQTNSTKLVIKVSTTSRMPKMIEYCGKNLEEVSSIMGNPDKVVSPGNGFSYHTYRESLNANDLQWMQFITNKKTGTIESVYLVYKDKQSCDLDFNYIKEHYFFDKDYQYYCNSSSGLLYSSIIFIETEVQGDYVITIQSINYAFNLPRIYRLSTVIGKTKDTAISLFGKPDQEANEDEGHASFTYNKSLEDADVELIEFLYEKKSSKIVAASILYPSETAYTYDLNYVKNNYTYDSTYNVYGNSKEGTFKSTQIIMQQESETQRIISIFDTQFIFGN